MYTASGAENTPSPGRSTLRPDLKIEFRGVEISEIESIPEIRLYGSENGYYWHTERNISQARSWLQEKFLEKNLDLKVELGSDIVNAPTLIIER